MKNPTLTTWLERENALTGDMEEVEVKVEYVLHRGCRGACDSLGVPLEPDEPECVEIVQATAGGVALMLSDRQEEQLREMAMDEEFDEAERRDDLEADLKREERKEL